MNLFDYLFRFNEKLKNIKIRNNIFFLKLNFKNLYKLFNYEKSHQKK